jgi:hypothetical protein
MKVSLKELRQLVREEILRGIPEFAVRDAARRYADTIRQHVKRHITMTVKSPVDLQEMLDASNQVIHELELEATELANNKLYQFMQKF